MRWPGHFVELLMVFGMERCNEPIEDSMSYLLLEIKSSHIINILLNLMSYTYTECIGVQNSVGSETRTKALSNVSSLPPTFSACGVPAVLRRHVMAVVCAGMARNGNNIGKFPSDSAATTARSARGWSGVNCSHQSGHQCHQAGWGASRGAQHLSKYLWTFQLKQQQQLGGVGCCRVLVKHEAIVSTDTGAS